MSQISGVGLVGIGGSAASRRFASRSIRRRWPPAASISRMCALSGPGQCRSAEGHAQQPAPDLHPQYQRPAAESRSQYADLVIAYRNGSPVRIRDVGRAVSAPENNLVAGWFNQQPCDHSGIQRQPGANVIQTVQRIKTMLPVLEASIPAAVKVSIISDRTQTIRASVADVQFTLLLTVCAGRDGDFHLPAQILGDRHSGGNGAVVADRNVRRTL